MTTTLEEPQTPLESQVKQESSRVALFSLFICALVTAVGSFASWYLFRKPQAEWSADTVKLSQNWPFVVLGVSVGIVIILITLARLHAFLALILAALAAGLLSRVGSLPPLPASATLSPSTAANHWVRAMEHTTIGFGSTAGSISVVIGLASVIGLCVLESGAADKIVRRFLAVFGEKRAGFALLLSTYVVSIPIFFDTIFMLLIPIAKALRMRTGKDYMLYVMAICLAGATTHSLVIPHPGPLAMADSLKVSTGLSIGVGLLSGLIPVLVLWVLCRWVNWATPAEVTETPGASLADLRMLMDRPESELPSLAASLTPILLPVFLISLASVWDTIYKSTDWEKYAAVSLAGRWFEFLGNRNIALVIATAIAVWLLIRQRKFTMAKVADMMGPPLETAGVIILITAAGGAFGTMLRNAGVGDAIKLAAEGREVNLIILSWAVAAVIRIAQGSATVAMLTTAAMISPMITGSLPYHPVYLFLAIGYGAITMSWMNDSGFWVVSRLGGLTEKQTLRSWTIVLTGISVVGLISTYLLAKVLPFAQPAAVVAQ